MDVPHLPTDNLYKFVAFSGLVLIVVGILFPVSLLTALTERKQELMLNAERLLFEAEALKRKQQQWRDKAKEIKERQKEGKATEEDNKQLEKRGLEIDEVGDLWVLKGIEYTKTQEFIHETAQRYRVYTFGMTGAAIVGVILFGSGFQLWYKRVQRYQDRALQAEATAKEREANKKGDG